jgi:prepilin-type N-terminal cleavage/methylation domain-containing protein
MNIAKRIKRAFTLVEIMIVVLIIGILLAVAVPNFMTARETSRSKACSANLHQIESAKEQYAMDNRLADGTAVAGLANLADYIKKTPECPSGGTYTAGAIGADPACSEGGTHIL